MLTDYQWEVIHRLKTNRYTLIRQYLHTFDNRYNILGVMCDVINPKGWYRDKDIRAGYCFMGFSMSLPQEVIKLYGISQGDAIKIYSINDDPDTTLSEKIEKLRELFYTANKRDNDIYDTTAWY